MLGQPTCESVLPIACDGVALPAIISAPAGDGPFSGLAVLILVGGPQYRVGSHRQFVQLARALARQGHLACRFDIRGMGDASGDARPFHQAGPDLIAAIDALKSYRDDVRGVVLWGLCDAASLILMHGCAHRAVTGVILANPWVRDERTLAAAMVKHYYTRRLASPEFWLKLLKGEVRLAEALQSLRGNLAKWLGRGRPIVTADSSDYRKRMADGLRNFRRPVLLVLSGEDLTAKEFLEHVGSDPSWRGLLTQQGVRRADLAGADHTFSRLEWKLEVERVTCQWLQATQCLP